VQQVKSNAKVLGETLVGKGLALATGGTDNHLLLVDLRPKGLTGSKMEKICDAVRITLNKNCVPGDRSALSPGGVRIGAPAMTTRGLKEADFVKVGEFLSRAVDLALAVQEKSGKKLKDFEAAIAASPEVKALGDEISVFAAPFFMPGV